MASPAQFERVVCELRFGAERSAVTIFGSRTIYDFWELLARNYASVMLPPQWRAMEGRVSWGWRQPKGGGHPSPEELGELRQRIRSALAAAPPTATNRLGRPVSARTLSDRETRMAVLSKGREILEQICELDDRELAGFACETEQGWRLHSWGAVTPAKPRIPGVPGYDVAGSVRYHGEGNPVPGRVSLMNDTGEVVASANLDDNQAFRFQQVVPGRYQVTGEFEGADLLGEGLTVEVNHGPLEGLQITALLHAPEIPIEQPPETPAAAPTSTVEPERRRKLPRWVWLVAIGVLLLLLGVLVGWLGWMRWTAPVRSGDLSDHLLPVGEWPLVVEEGAVRSVITPPPPPPPPADPLAVTPFQLSAALGDPARFQLSYIPENATRIQWRRNGEALTGETGQAFEIPSVDLDDFGVYDAVVGWAEEEIVARAGELVKKSGGDDEPPIVPPIPPEPQKPEILQQPSGLDLEAGQSGILQARTSGYPTPETRWFKNGQSLPNSGLPALRIDNAQLDDSGTYWAEFSNQLGQVRTDPVEVTVRDPSAPEPEAPEVITSPNSQSVEEGDDVTLSVETTGTPTPDLQWRRQGLPIRGANQSTLRLRSVSSADSGEYDVVVTNTEGSTSSEPAVIDVKPYKQEWGVIDMAWRSRRMTDFILPTVPEVVGRDDGRAAIREMLISTGRLHPPRTLFVSQAWVGITIEYRLPTGQPPPTWVNAQGSPLMGGWATRDRAEFSWVSEAAPEPEIRLEQSDGHVIARVTVQQSEISAILTGLNSRCLYWVGVEQHASDLTQTEFEVWRDRLRWFALEDGESRNDTLPSGWEIVDGWQNGRGFRLNLPASDYAADQEIELALVDGWTGQALIHAFRYKQ